MTPAARVQAAIGILDRIATGEAAERALTRWARGARYAGSGDRAAVRDHVFDAVRRWWSSAALGGGEDGRARMIGLLRGMDSRPEDLFIGGAYGPPPLTEAETASPLPLDPLTALDCPRWLAPELQASLGGDFAPVMERLRTRAPVHLRVSLSRSSRDAAILALRADGIDTRPHPLSPTALEVTDGARRIAGSRAYATGLVELQDAASQAVVDAIPLAGATRILDYCAGGGGKTLAMADRHAALYHAHDAAPRRMADLPARADRAGLQVARRDTADLRAEPPYDVVVVDAPCSGSGAWRRSPEGKIRLTPARLEELRALQADVLDAAHAHLRAGGALVYATCSLLESENVVQARSAAHRLGLVVMSEMRLTPLDDGDGFYCAVLADNS
ncbi:RsmB/NOP family class I SAM-dependent RNA methyltransferase [Palleronia rufa]|uniref:RsmB/NOP family class I SAM-dependent RNA methyltransferase n=1 Tax=Palleronia rufa TaxID=1530186 RepID=UPI0005624492|nr:RsmB/NOP family class I SAM-dependent RNA methyltransferase [Palleronia rufa]